MFLDDKGLDTLYKLIKNGGGGIKTSTVISGPSSSGTSQDFVEAAIQAEKEDREKEDDNLRDLINAETRRATTAENQEVIDRIADVGRVEHKLNTHLSEVEKTITDLTEHCDDNLDLAKAYTDAKTTGAMIWRGTVATLADLPGNATLGDFYTVKGENNGEYAWDGSKWEYIGSQVDLSGITEDLNKKANDSDVVHKAGTETITGSKTFSNPVRATQLVSVNPNTRWNSAGLKATRDPNGANKLSAEIFVENNSDDAEDSNLQFLTYNAAGEKNTVFRTTSASAQSKDSIGNSTNSLVTGKAIKDYIVSQGFASAGNTYTKVQVDGFLAGKEDKGTCYTKAEADNNFQVKGNYLTEIPDNSITTAKIKDGAVTAQKLDSSLLDKINSASTKTDLADLASQVNQNTQDLTTKANSSDVYTKTQADSTFQAKGNYLTGIPDNSITTPKIKDGAVTTAKIADANVTEAKLGTTLANKINGKANSSDVVKLTGDQTVGGVKTFSSSPKLSTTTGLNSADKDYITSTSTTLMAGKAIYDYIDGKGFATTSALSSKADTTALNSEITRAKAAEEANTTAITDLTTTVSTKANDSDVVKLTGDQTVGGVKDFSDGIKIKTAAISSFSSGDRRGFYFITKTSDGTYVKFELSDAGDGTNYIKSGSKLLISGGGIYDYIVSQGFAKKTGKDFIPRSPATDYCRVGADDFTPINGENTTKANAASTVAAGDWYFITGKAVKNWVDGEHTINGKTIFGYTPEVKGTDYDACKAASIKSDGKQLIAGKAVWDYLYAMKQSPAIENNSEDYESNQAASIKNSKARLITGAAVKRFVDSSDSNLVHRSGNETISDYKRFTGRIYLGSDANCQAFLYKEPNWGGSSSAGVAAVLASTSKADSTGAYQFPKFMVQSYDDNRKSVFRFANTTWNPSGSGSWNWVEYAQVTDTSGNKSAIANGTSYLVTGKAVKDYVADSVSTSLGDYVPKAGDCEISGNKTFKNAIKISNSSSDYTTVSYDRYGRFNSNGSQLTGCYLGGSSIDFEYEGSSNYCRVNANSKDHTKAITGTSVLLPSGKAVYDYVGSRVFGSSQIATQAITSIELADNSVSTVKVQNQAITSDKLASGAGSYKELWGNTSTAVELTKNLRHLIVLSYKGYWVDETKLEAGDWIELVNNSPNTIKIYKNSGLTTLACTVPGTCKLMIVKDTEVRYNVLGGVTVPVSARTVNISAVEATWWSENQCGYIYNTSGATKKVHTIYIPPSTTEGTIQEIFGVFETPLNTLQIYINSTSPKKLTSWKNVTGLDLKMIYSGGKWNLIRRDVDTVKEDNSTLSPESTKRVLTIDDLPKKSNAPYLLVQGSSNTENFLYLNSIAEDTPLVLGIDYRYKFKGISFSEITVFNRTSYVVPFQVLVTDNRTTTTNYTNGDVSQTLGSITPSGGVKRFLVVVNASTNNVTILDISVDYKVCCDSPMNMQTN